MCPEHDQIVGDETLDRFGYCELDMTLSLNRLM